MIKPQSKVLLAPDLRFHNEGKTLNFAVGDFWQWAFSDLQQNNIRGIFSEFLVAKALNIPLGIRQTWDDYDLRTPDGFKIEVKSGAYLQSWQQKELSKIVFKGLCGQAWDQQEGRRGGKAVYRADVYVFAVQTAKDHDVFDPLDIKQWQFYVLPKSVLERKNVRSMSLTSVQKYTDHVPYSGLEAKVHEARHNS